jgi:hypothetical protein
VIEYESNTNPSSYYRDILIILLGIGMTVYKECNNGSQKNKIEKGGKDK